VSAGKTGATLGLILGLLGPVIVPDASGFGGTRGTPEAAAGDADTVRTLSVTLVTDRAFRQLPWWRGLAGDIIENATADLAASVGLHLKPGEEVAWDPPAGIVTLEGLLDAGAHAAGPRPGLVAVLLGKRPPGMADPSEMGIAFLGRPALLVLPPERSRSRDAVLRHYTLFFRHELGHVFGIPHVAGRSVMNASPNRMNAEFGILDLEVLRANRNLDFTADLPFTGSDLTLLRDAYLLLNERGNMETALLVNLGSALYHAARYPEAAEVFRAAHARDRRAARPRLGEARCALALGDTAQARDLLASPGPSPAWTPEELGWLGTLWLEAGDLDRSRDVLADAAGRDPSRPETWFNLGLVLDAQGNRKDAADAFRRYLTLAPDGDRSDDARAYLEKH
jgi:hypothetical protein